MMHYLKPEVIVLAYLLVIVPILFWFGKLPTVQTAAQFANLLNTRGGNILLLGGLSVMFFISAARYIYHSMELIHVGTIVTSDAQYQLGMTFFTSTAFSSCFGALLKTMTGEPVEIPPVVQAAAPTEAGK